MSQQLIGQPIATADNSATSPGVFQSFEFTSNASLFVARATIIQYNNPTYTTVEMKLYGQRASSIGKLLYTSSNAVTKATIGNSLSHAWRDVYFTFNTRPTFKAGDTYYAALYINGAYTGDSSSHLAWASSWPDPIYDTGLTINQAQAATLPLAISFISSAI